MCRPFDDEGRADSVWQIGRNASFDDVEKGWQRLSAGVAAADADEPQTDTEDVTLGRIGQCVFSNHYKVR